MTGDGGKGNLPRKGRAPGGCICGEGGEAGSSLLSPQSARKPLGKPTSRCRAGSRSPGRGCAPLPAGTEEGNAGARRWAELEGWWGLGLGSALSPQAARSWAGGSARSHRQGTAPIARARLPAPAWRSPAPAMRFFEIQKSEF